jgi:hypothetical protein
VALIWNLTYSGGEDEEDHNSKQAQSNSLQDPTLKISTQNRAGRLAQVAEYLLGKCEALSSNPSNVKKKKPLW